MILFCCASELGPPEDLSAIEVILYYYYYIFIVVLEMKSVFSLNLCSGDVYILPL